MLKLIAKVGFVHIAAIVIGSLWLLLWSMPVRGRDGGSKVKISAQSGLIGPRGIQEEWMEVLLGSQKVGYSFSKISPTEAGYTIKEELFLRLSLMGVTRNLHTTTDTSVDRDFLMKKFRFEINSGLVSFHMAGEVRGLWLVVERGEGEKKFSTRIKLESPPVASAAIPFILKARHAAMGQTRIITIFDPSSLALIKVPITAVSQDQINVLGKRYRTTKYVSEIMGHKVFFWMSESGQLIKQSGMMGLTLVRSDANHARQGIGEGGTKELYDMVAVVPDKTIKRPRKLTLLKVRISGISPQVIRLDPYDTRQVLQGDILTIKKDKLPEKIEEKIRVNPGLKKKVWGFLRPEMNIESNGEGIKQKAREITRGAHGAIERARKLLSWVYKHVEKKPVIGIPSATETLKNLEGDCNEHAVLMAALLRASGIPAKVCVGLVYARGKFYYHAWNEAFLLGKWVSMDATLGQMPVDATHIKIVQRGLDKQMEIMRVMGRLKLHVLEEQWG